MTFEAFASTAFGQFCIIALVVMCLGAMCVAWAVTADRQTKTNEGE